MTKQFSAIKLMFRGPLALMSEKKDEFKPEITHIPSDTLKAALVSALGFMGDEKNVKKLNENLIVSSAYPYLNDIFFFPRPRIQMHFSGVPEDPGFRKKIKRIAFLDRDLFEKVINGEEISFDNIIMLHNGKFWLKKHENLNINTDTKIYAVQSAGRVQIGNLNVFSESEKGDPYYVSRTYFKRNDDKEHMVSGLYFIYHTDDEQPLEKALNILKDEGLGSDRKFGNGHFEWEKVNLQLNIPENPAGYVLLSRYIPGQNEIANNMLKTSSFELALSSGYISGTVKEGFAHWLRKNIWMIEAGSVLNTSEDLKGKQVVVSTDEMEKALGHQVFRDGRAITIGYK